MVNLITRIVSVEIVCRVILFTEILLRLLLSFIGSLQVDLHPYRES